MTQPRIGETAANLRFRSQIGRQFSAGLARTAEKLGIGKGCGTSCRPPVQQYVGSKAAYLFTFSTEDLPRAAVLAP